MSVIIETTAGDFTLDLFTEDRPRASLNFLKLCKTKYYNFCLFHKIERNFTAQTGDPSGTGRGGESVFNQLYGEQARFFEAETKPRIKHTDVGTVSMINNGENMHGSQFFITLGEELDFLDGVHTAFGRVTEGIDILMKINDTICDGENKPYQDIRITHTVVLDDPYDDPAGLIVPGSSPEPTEEQLRSSRIGVDEEIDYTKGKTLEVIEEEIRDKEAKARATILEMVGDIPDVEVAPPDNVLFVCKLNPVTTAEDLEVIFSRFGTILSCEVIKDRKSGESLQYSFIEFENPNECENAYFKMDNVLIDDRRIHVDFSQSVSKLNWQEMRKNARGTFKRPQFKLKNTQPESGKYDLIFQDEPTSKRTKDSKQSHNDKKRSKKHSPDRSSPRRSKSEKSQPELARSEKLHSKQPNRQSSKRYHSRSRSRDRHQGRPRYRARSKDRKDYRQENTKKRSPSSPYRFKGEKSARSTSRDRKGYRQESSKQRSPSSPYRFKGESTSRDGKDKRQENTKQRSPSSPYRFKGEINARSTSRDRKEKQESSKQRSPSSPYRFKGDKNPRNTSSSDRYRERR